MIPTVCLIPHEAFHRARPVAHSCSQWREALRARYGYDAIDYRWYYRMDHGDPGWGESQCPAGIEATYVRTGEHTGIKVYARADDAETAFRWARRYDDAGIGAHVYSDHMEAFLDRNGHEVYGFRIEHVPFIGEGCESELQDAAQEAGFYLGDMHGGNYGTTADGRVVVVDTGAYTTGGDDPDSSSDW